MSRRRYLLLYLLGFGVALTSAWLQKSPGYMDADYYFLGGYRLATGHGFSEPVVWNYLDNPDGLPHPSHAYWMPLASILVALGIGLSGSQPPLPLEAFNPGRIGFLAVAGMLPVSTANLAWSLTRRKDLATLAGVLACLPGFYLPFLTTTDTFLLYMLLGAVFLNTAGALVSWRAPTEKPPRLQAPKALILGLLAGLMHLARADGAMWVLIGLAAVWWAPSTSASGESQRPYPSRAPNMVLVLVGYLLVMAPWMARNTLVFGTPLAPGGSRTLWLTHYNELFIYPATLLRPDRWLASGLWHLFRVRLQSVGIVALSALTVQGQIYLAPLIVLGTRRLWGDLRVRLGVLAWALTFLEMTLVFPEPGWRGGFFHSGAAVQPLFWALAPVGLVDFIRWGKRRRGWQPAQAWNIFRGATLAFGALLTAFSLTARVVGARPAAPLWSASNQAYLRAEARLQELGAGPEAVVAVNNPPGYAVATGRSAIVIPYGDMDLLREVGERYGARYLVLEANHPDLLDDMYAQPGDRRGLRYLGSLDDMYLYAMDPAFQVDGAPEADP